MQKVEKLIFSLRREKKFKGYLLVRRYISTISIEEKKEMIKVSHSFDSKNDSEVATN